MYYILCSFAFVTLLVFAMRSLTNGAWIVLLPFVVSVFIAIISSLYIETGIYIFEQGATSYLTGATARLIFIFFIFFGVYFLVNRALSSSWKYNWYDYHKLAFPNVALFVAGCLLILMIVNVYISDTPPLFKSGYISRFEYIEGTRLWAYVSYFGVVATIIPVLSGFAFSYFFNNNKKNRAKISVFILLVYLAYLIMIGHKFGGLVFGAFYFILPFMVRYAHKYGSIKLLLKVMPLGLMSIVIIFSIVYFHYSTYSLADSYGGPLNFIAYRVFGLQAHVWWGIDQYVFINGHDQFLSYEGLAQSMPAMMRIVGVSGIEDAIDRGVNFTFGFPASAFLFFGLSLGVIVVGGMAALTAILVRVVIINIFRNDLVGYFLSVYLLLWLFGILSNGSFELFLSTKFIVFFLSLIMYKLIVRLAECQSG